MESSTFRLSLDIRRQVTQAHLAVKKGDTGRQIIATLSDGGVPFQIDEGCYAVFMAQKPDGNVLYNDCTIENDRIIYSFTEQTASAAGRMICELRLYDSDDMLITSPRIAIIVSGTVYEDSEVESTAEFTALSAAMTDLAELKKNGLKGDEGASAYEVAVADGFEGSEEEWLESLRGPQGEPGEGSFYVSVAPTVDDSGALGRLAADETFAEIMAAYGTGKTVYCLVGHEYVLPLAMVSGDGSTVIFQGVNKRYYQRVVISSDDNLTYTSGNYALRDDLPTALPNPSKLILTGAVAAEYDGSGEVAVEIPEVAGADGKSAYEYAKDGGYTGTEEEFAAMLAAPDGAVYYSSLSAAITDINNGGTENAVMAPSAAKVKVFTAHTGALTVMLLDDVAESAQIDINKDIDLALNDHTLFLIAAGAYLNFAEGTSCAIYGGGSGAIVKRLADASATSYLVSANGDSLVLHGGSYTGAGSNSASTLVFRVGSTSNVFELDGCNVTLGNTATSLTSMAKAIQSQGAVVRIKGSKITVDTGSWGYGVAVHAGSADITDSTITVSCTGNTTYPSCCVYNVGTVTVEHTAMTGDCSGGNMQCLYNAGTATVDHATISANSDSNNAWGVYNSDGVVRIKDSTVFADAIDCHADAAHAVGIYSSGTLYCDGTDVTGTHSGINNGGILYVNGGTHTGYCHGGIYFAHGEAGIAYVNDATLRCGNYTGSHDYSGKSGEIYGCLYVGGGSTDNCSNMAVYLDGCTIGAGGGNNTLVLRGTDGERNNTLNLSNCTIIDGSGLIRIDSETLSLNVGIGTNVTTDMIDNPDYAVFTGRLYRKNAGDKTCDGKDYDTLAVLADGIAEPELIVDVTVDEAVAQVIVNQDIDGNAFSLMRYRAFVLFPETGYDAKSSYSIKQATYSPAITTTAMTAYERGVYLYTDAFAPRDYATHHSTPVPVYSADMGGYTRTAGWTSTLTQLLVVADDETYPVPAGTRIRIWGERE